MKLSVIIPTRNRSKLLDKTLDSLSKQTLSNNYYEVLVIDNDSSDGTKEVVENCQNGNVKYLYEKKVGLHYGRHRGLREAKSDILVYADDDILAFPEWLETIQYVFENDKDVVLVGGKNLPLFECEVPFWIKALWNKGGKGNQVLGELSLLDLGDKVKTISPFFVFGCNFSIRKKTLIDAGGFHPDGMPFDLIHFRGDGETHVSEFINRTKQKTIYHPSASVYHWVSEKRMTIEYFQERSYIQGVSDAFSYIRKRYNDKITNDKPKLLLKIKRRTIYLINKVFRNRNNYTETSKILSNITLSDLEKIKKHYHNLGYQYLLNCYRNDEETQKWINKENYMND
jgi:glycosyltransferase involved in cell wall biosynthesis